MMCQKCVDAIKKFWPKLPEDKYYDLLINATCFPFGCGEETARQVKEMAEKSGCNLNKAIRIACEETDEAMKDTSNVPAH